MLIIVLKAMILLTLCSVFCKRWLISAELDPEQSNCVVTIPSRAVRFRLIKPVVNVFPPNVVRCFNAVVLATEAQKLIDTRNCLFARLVAAPSFVRREFVL